MFDVLLNRNGNDIPIRTNITKREAKKLVKELRKAGNKAQLVTSKGRLLQDVDLRQGESNEAD